VTLNSFSKLALLRQNIQVSQSLGQVAIVVRDYDEAREFMPRFLVSV
jgi:hypothetical protein